MSKQPIRCDKCNEPVEADYSHPYQEYPGAAVQDGFWYYACPCGHEDLIKDIGNYNIKENKRGW